MYVKYIYLSLSDFLPPTPPSISFTFACSSLLTSLTINLIRRLNLELASDHVFALFSV